MQILVAFQEMHFCMEIAKKLLQKLKISRLGVRTKQKEVPLFTHRTAQLKENRYGIQMRNELSSYLL